MASDSISSILWPDDEAIEPLPDETVERGKSKQDNKASSVTFYHSPQNLNELLGINGFSKLLRTGLVFIHNKKNCSDHLISHLVDHYKNNNEIMQFKNTRSFTSSFSRKMKSPLPKTNNKGIWIIEATSIEDNLSQTCNNICKLKSANQGIWVRGFIQELTPQNIHLFDIVIAYDMSNREYEILKTAISIPGDLKESLSFSKGTLAEEIPFFLFINYSNLPNAPLLISNPYLLEALTDR